MTKTENLWRCPVCNHVMTDEQSKGYRGCPTGIHFAQHELIMTLPKTLTAALKDMGAKHTSETDKWQLLAVVLCEYGLAQGVDLDAEIEHPKVYASTTHYESECHTPEMPMAQEAAAASTPNAPAHRPEAKC